MTLVRRNLVANFAGNGWVALMNLAFVPLYIKFMGIEAYGLIGFFATLQSMFVLLDLGLTTTLNRELARHSALPDEAQEMRNLVRTLEIVYWGIAVLIGAAVLSLAPFIARHWIKAESLPISVVQQAVMLMGLIMAFRWPLSFYAGGLLGLQRQVLCSSLNAGWGTLRSLGAVLVLWLVSPTILAFFTYQVFVGVCSTTLTALALWRSLPAGQQPPCFQANLLRSIWRFTAGMSAISVTVLLLTNLDRIILSKLIPLEMFGYYSLARTVAGGLRYLSSPVFIALFPSFSQRVVLGDTEGLKVLYHRSCQLMSVVILPVAAVVAFFAPEILLLWTQNPTMVENVRWLVSLLIIGTALNGLMNMPYALQLAHGWTKLAIYVNVGAITLLTPLLVVMVTRYGAIGAAVVWVALNSGYVLVSIQIMHRRLLKGEQWRWYTEDVGLPLVASLVVVGLGRWLIHGQMSLSRMFLSLMAVSALAFVASGLAAPEVRAWGLGQIRRMRRADASAS